MLQYMYFRNSHTVLIQIDGGQIWQSSNEGYTWSQLFRHDYFIAIYMNPYWNDRAWLLTNTRKVYMTTDTGATWIEMQAPMEPNIFGVAAVNFHPKQSDWLIWVGSTECTRIGGPNCRTEAFYSKDHGRRWIKFDNYVRTCNWARDKGLKIDEKEIICESYRDKKGDQMTFVGVNPLQLVMGKEFYSQKTVLFHNVVGFARFSEYLLVAEVSSFQFCPKDHHSLNNGIDCRWCQRP